MAGQLTIDTLKASSGVLATQNGMTGIAKAWVNFTGTTLNGSFNVSSVTKNATGDYTVNFTTAMVNANYSATVSAGNGAGGGSAANVTAPYGSNPTTTAFRIGTFNYLFSATDFTYNSVSILGA